jgi:hypothetical protein
MYMLAAEKETQLFGVLLFSECLPLARKYVAYMVSSYGGHLHRQLFK